MKNGRLILAGLVALVAFAVFAVPRIQQGWQKHHATEVEFGDTDRYCALAYVRANALIEKQKLFHDVCMRDRGWAALQTWQ